MTTKDRKPMRRIEDLTLAECNAIFERLSEMFGVKDIQTAIDGWKPPLTDEQSAVMLTEVLTQAQEALQ